MFTQFRKITFIVAFLALVGLTGCTGTMNGGGRVTLLEVQTGLGDGVPTEATIAVSATCNDHKDSFRATLHVTDNDNGANFTVRLPWTPVADIADINEGDFTTCEEAAAFVEANGFSVAGGLFDPQDDLQDPESGGAAVLVSAPGLAPELCGDLQVVEIEAEGSADVLPGGGYLAAGCLDHGKINFQ
jgi:hypothetical protein